MNDPEPKEESAHICAELEAFIERRRRFYSRSLLTGVGGIGVFILLGFMIALFGQTLEPTPALRIFMRCFAIMTAISLPALFVPFFWYMATTLRTTMRAKIERLGELKVPAASGTLLRLLCMTEGSVRKAVEQALIQIIPLWDDEQFAAFTSQERRCIRHCIIPGMGGTFPRGNKGDWQDPRTIVFNSPLRAALCRKLALYGNQEDLITIKRAINFPNPFLWNREVRETARESIPLLEARLAEERAPEILLRASVAPAASPEELLRAAASSAAISADGLLHPAAEPLRDDARTSIPEQ